MNNNEKYKRVLKFTSTSVILAIEIILYWYIWIKYYNAALNTPFWRRGNWLIVALYSIQLIFFLRTYGGFGIGYLTRANVIYSQILSIFFVNIIAYIQLALIDMRFHNPDMFIVLTLVDIFCVFVWAFAFQRLYSYLFPARSLLIVYGDRPVFHILEKLTTRDDKYEIRGAINIDKGIDKIMSMAKNYEGIIIGDISSHDRNIILKECYKNSIRSYIIPKISDYLTKSSIELNLFDTPILLSRNDGLAIDQIFIKRVIDIVLSLLMLIITLPLFIIFGACIKYTDRGPVFYTQKRLTKDGEIFDIIKFRTMKMDAEKDGIARLSGVKDDRVTKIGKILRATRLDELPQLINIIKGQMSLVGPRPERPEIAKEYEKEIPEFCFRLKMKAGLTGYAQIYGKYNTTPYDKLKLDLKYIRNYSIWLDLKLILMTPKVLFMKSSTEGIESGAVTAMKNNLKEEVYGKAQNLESVIGNKK